MLCAGKGISLPVPSWNDLTARIDDIAMAVSNEDTEYACKLSNTKQATVKMFKGKTQVLMSARVHSQPNSDKCCSYAPNFVSHDHDFLSPYGGDGWAGSSPPPEPFSFFPVWTP